MNKPIKQPRTEGPWTVQLSVDGDYLIRGPNGERIATVARMNNAFDFVGEGNVRLLGAALAMFLSLRGIVDAHAAWLNSLPPEVRDTIDDPLSDAVIEAEAILVRLNNPLPTPERRS